MLKSFEPFEHPFDKTLTYFSATFDTIGAQAILWSAIDQRFEASKHTPEHEVAEYCVNTIPEISTDEVQLRGRGFDWEYIEAMLASYGRKVVELSQHNPTFSHHTTEVMPWPRAIVLEMHIAGSRARRLAEALRFRRTSWMDSEIS